MELAGNAFWFVLIFGAILICGLFLILRSVFAAFARHMNVTASASGTPAPEMTTATGNAMFVGLALGFFLAWLVMSFVAYFGIDLLIRQKGTNTASVSVSSSSGGASASASVGAGPSTAPIALVNSSEAAPTGVEYEKLTGNVTVTSLRPAGYRLQVEFTRLDGLTQPLDLGENQGGTVIPNSSFVQARWFKGSEVTGFTPATPK